MPFMMRMGLYHFGMRPKERADKGTAEAVSGPVRLRAVHELAIEEEHVPGLHDYRHDLQPLRNRDGLDPNACSLAFKT